MRVNMAIVAAAATDTGGIRWYRVYGIAVGCHGTGVAGRAR